MAAGASMTERYLCHGCGESFAEEQPDLTCPYCGEPRRMVEDTENDGA